MAQVSTLRRSFPLFYALFGPVRWLFGSWRRVAGLIGVVLAVVAAFPIWWSIQLVGLPDVGDPFDVAAFRAATIPDDRNAFILYRQAAAVFKQPIGLSLPAGQPGFPPANWAALKPAVRQWVESNREALDLWRQGADRAEGLNSPPGDAFQGAAYVPFLTLPIAVLLEASRFEADGDMAGAWDWYHTHVRTIRHFGTRGTRFWREQAQTWHFELLRRLPAWAADPRTPPSLIRRALDDVEACAAMIPSDADTLKLEYLAAEQGPFEWDRVGRRSAPPAWVQFLGSRGFLVYLQHINMIDGTIRSWRREPERCRRLGRLLMANRLAWLELPPARRPPPDPMILTLNLYPFGAEAPPAARALTPDRLDRWLDTTANTWGLIDFLDWKKLRSEEAANRRALVALLASELYRRDHQGGDPPTLEALIGSYLKSLPPESPE